VYLLGNYSLEGITMSIKLVKDPRKVSESLASHLEKWNWFLNSKTYYWFVVFDKQGRWVGYGALSIYDRDTIYLGPSYVCEQMRGCGLQRKLIKARERWARKQGYTRAISVVDYNNLYSANNLIKCGYLLRKPWPGFAQEYLYLFFEKRLVK
jgi:L-amino acid N-acyltransferase YncA